MGRQRLYDSDAERQAAYRERRAQDERIRERDAQAKAQRELDDATQMYQWAYGNAWQSAMERGDACTLALLQELPESPHRFTGDNTGRQLVFNVAGSIRPWEHDLKRRKS